MRFRYYGDRDCCRHAAAEEARNNAVYSTTEACDVQTYNAATFCSAQNRKSTLDWRAEAPCYRACESAARRGIELTHRAPNLYASPGRAAQGGWWASRVSGTIRPPG